MKTYIAPELEIVEVDALRTLLFMTSPQNTLPSEDDPLNQFVKKNNYVDFSDDSTLF